jgi:hypothetical protein
MQSRMTVKPVMLSSSSYSFDSIVDCGGWMVDGVWGLVASVKVAGRKVVSTSSQPHNRQLPILSSNQQPTTINPNLVVGHDRSSPLPRSLCLSLLLSVLSM